MLLSVQERNEVFQYIAENSVYDINDFEWMKIEGYRLVYENDYSIGPQIYENIDNYIQRDSGCSGAIDEQNILVYKPLKSYFIFDTKIDDFLERSYRLFYYYPKYSRVGQINRIVCVDLNNLGLESKNYPLTLQNGLLHWFLSLYNNLGTDNKSSRIVDLWDKFSTGNPALRNSDSIPADNRAFDEAEKQFILQKLPVIHHYLQNGFKVEDPSKAYVIERLEYLGDASKRLGRKDWLNVFFSAIVNIILLPEIPAKAATDVFRFISGLFETIFEDVKP